VKRAISAIGRYAALSQSTLYMH